MRRDNSVCKVTEHVLDNLGSILGGGEFFFSQHILNGFGVNNISYAVDNAKYYSRINRLERGGNNLSLIIQCRDLYRQFHVTSDKAPYS
jgi:hypothetical protein